MPPGITKTLSAIAEFLVRFWPMSKTEDQILEEQRAFYRADPSTDDPPDEGTTD